MRRGSEMHTYRTLSAGIGAPENLTSKGRAAVDHVSGLQSNCAFSRLILQSIRAWIGSTQSMKVLAQIELHWLELDASSAWPALEEFLAIIFFERQRDICIAKGADSGRMTADEVSLLVALTVARWDMGSAAQCLGRLLSEMSAYAAATAAARFGAALGSLEFGRICKNGR